MEKPIAISIVLSTSGSRIGGAAIAAEFHTQYMNRTFPMELWRMWDQDEEFYRNGLKIKSFLGKTPLEFLNTLLPKKIKFLILDSDILEQILVTRPSLIHLHNPLPSIAFERIAAYASQAGIKVVVSTHGFYEVMHPSYGLKFYEKLIWKQWITKPICRSLQYVDAVFSLYPDEKNMLVDIGVPAEKIHLAPNGVNPFLLSAPTAEEKSAVIEKFNISLNAPILLFIGNHTGNKGLATVMEVASKLSGAATFVIGGKLLTPDEPQQWQEQFPTSDRVQVIFTDYLTTAEQRALYYLSNLLLFPSLADTLPLTIIEAMACGLPVIAYDVGGIPYQLQDGCGILVPAGDVTGFFSAVEQAISDPTMCSAIAHRAKLKQEQTFSWEKTAQLTIDIYQQLLKI